MKPDIKGLMKLGRALRRVPKARFRQGHWWTKTFDEDAKGGCGTAGCVAGWAATLFPHRFRKVNEESIGKAELWYEVEHRSSGKTGTEAFARGFRIDYEDAEHITNGEASHQTPKRAAQAVFRLVNKLKKQMKSRS